MIRPFWLFLLPLALSGCNWIGRQADALGEHMPVIGERCEHWQCMTSEGRARSDAIKAEEQRQQEQQTPPQTTVIYPDASPADTAVESAGPPEPERKSFAPPDVQLPADPVAEPDKVTPPL